MIRPLNENDLDEFIRIRLEGLQKDPAAFGAAYEDGVDRNKTYHNLKQKNEEDFILGYFDQDILLGIIGFFKNNRLKKKHKAMIWGMYVSKNARGKGIGRQLMEKCIQKAQQLKGLQKINLSVIHTQSNAIYLYQKLGFETYGKETASLLVDGQSYDEIFMSKVLKKPS